MAGITFGFGWLKMGDSKREKENAAKLAFLLGKASSDSERAKIIKDFFEDGYSIPDAAKEELIEEFVSDVRGGYDEYDLRDEIEQEMESNIRERILEEFGYDKGNYARWVFVRDRLIRNSIKSVVEALEQLFEIVRMDNLASSDGGLITPLQKEQLLAILKATIAELEAPYVDIGRISLLKKWLGRIASKGEIEGIPKGIYNGVENAKNKITDLLNKVKDESPKAPF